MIKYREEVYRGEVMKVKDFDFDLPEELIAQVPLEERSSSKLLVVKEDGVEDRHFFEIVNYLNKGDVLVLNDTRVLSARLFGVKEETGAKVELLVLKHTGDIVECLVGNAKVVKVDTVVSFGDGRLKAKCLEVKDEGIRIFEFIYEGIFLEVLESLGEMPLPPYIHETLKDKERYQTVYSKEYGSAAAPTAGLHFTPELLDEIRNKGVIIAPITLHVGLGTFRPVKMEVVEEHIMHAEEYEMSEGTAHILNKAIQDNRRIIAVGTTSVRTLETIYNLYDTFKECKGESEIFIYPGYKFRSISGIITNFHLPKSTLIMLVSAFSGQERIMNAYKHAIEKEYRFFSFGDSMFIEYKED